MPRIAMKVVAEELGFRRVLDVLGSRKASITLKVRPPES